MKMVLSVFSVVCGLILWPYLILLTLRTGYWQFSASTGEDVVFAVLLVSLGSISSSGTLFVMERSKKYLTSAIIGFALVPSVIFLLLFSIGKFGNFKKEESLFQFTSNIGNIGDTTELLSTGLEKPNQLNIADCTLEVISDSEYKRSTAVKIKLMYSGEKEILIIDPVLEGVRILRLDGEPKPEKEVYHSREARFRPYLVSWGLVFGPWTKVGEEVDGGLVVPAGEYQVEFRYIPSERYTDVGSYCVARSKPFKVLKESLWMVIDESE